MATKWYCAKNGKEYGPFSSGQLKELATSGRLRPADMVRTDGGKEWQPASNLPGLFDNSASQPVAPPPPPIKVVVPPPVQNAASPLFQFEIDTKRPSGKGPTIRRSKKRAFDFNNPTVGLLFQISVGVLVVFFALLKFGMKGCSSDQATQVAGTVAPNHGEQRPSKAEAEKPTEEERIQLIVLTAAAFVVKQGMENGLTPEAFNRIARTAAKELGSGNFDDTRHLLQIEPTSREQKTLDSGNKAIFLSYGRPSAHVNVAFFQNVQTGEITFVKARAGDQEVPPNLTVGKRNETPSKAAPARTNPTAQFAGFTKRAIDLLEPEKHHYVKPITGETLSRSDAVHAMIILRMRMDYSLRSREPKDSAEVLEEIRQSLRATNFTFTWFDLRIGIAEWRKVFGDVETVDGEYRMIRCKDGLITVQGGDLARLGVVDIRRFYFGVP